MANERYQRLQRKTGSKNNVVDFAETPEFEREKQALSWSMLRSNSASTHAESFALVVLFIMNSKRS